MLRPPFVDLAGFGQPRGNHMPNTRQIEGTLVRSYSTGFERHEAPISEGGMWINGRRDGIDWCDVLTRDGHAYGEVTRMSAAERRSEQALDGEAAGGAAQE